MCSTLWKTFFSEKWDESDLVWANSRWWSPFHARERKGICYSTWVKEGVLGIMRFSHTSSEKQLVVWQVPSVREILAYGAPWITYSVLILCEEFGTAKRFPFHEEMRRLIFKLNNAKQFLKSKRRHRWTNLKIILFLIYLADAFTSSREVAEKNFTFLKRKSSEMSVIHSFHGIPLHHKEGFWHRFHEEIVKNYLADVHDNDASKWD